MITVSRTGSFGCSVTKLADGATVVFRAGVSSMFLRCKTAKY